MTTSFEYTSTVVKKVKPTIVKLYITMTADAIEAKNAIYKCAGYNKELANMIFKMPSYVKNSYTQSNFSVIKQFKEDATFVSGKPDLTTTKIFDKYTTWLKISASFKNSDQIIDDITNLLTLLNQDYFSFTYECSLSDNQLNILNNELYSEAINLGINNIKQIFTNTALRSLSAPSNEVSNNLLPTITITHIADHIADHTVNRSFELAQTANNADTDTDTDTLIPEMLKLTFNNCITFSKSIDLIAEITF